MTMTGQWASVEYMAPQMIEDTPVYEATTARVRKQAIAQAATEGHTLSEEYTVRQEPTVWVEDWSEDGGAYIAPAVARLTGIDTDALKPGPMMVVHEWQILS